MDRALEAAYVKALRCYPHPKDDQFLKDVRAFLRAIADNPEALNALGGGCQVDAMREAYRALANKLSPAHLCGPGGVD